MSDAPPTAAPAPGPRKVKWSIAAIDSDASEAAAAAAGAARETVGEWVAGAIRQRIRSDRMAPPDMPQSGPSRADRLSELERIAAAMSALSGTGPVPRYAGAPVRRALLALIDGAGDGPTLTYWHARPRAGEQKRIADGAEADA